MNVLRIRSLASDGNLSKEAVRYLINCRGECEHLDYKCTLDLNDTRVLGKLCKDILAMKNVGGGFLVIGVRDKTWEPVGLKSRIEVDSKMLRDMVNKITGVYLEVDIVHHSLVIKEKSKLFAAILVRSTIKRSKLRVPKPCKNNYNPNEKWGLRSGVIYVRKGDSTIKVSTDTELQELLNNLELIYQQEEIQQASDLSSPFAVESGLFRLLPKEYERFIGRRTAKKKLIQAIEEHSRIWIYNLYGPGGVGKSALATWIAYKYYEESRFESILYLSAKDKELSSEEGRVRRLSPTLLSLDDLFDHILRLFEEDRKLDSSLDKKRGVVTEILDAFSMLCVLDNMETVSDHRIFDYIYDLPESTKVKILLTSRKRLPQWEYPFQLQEFSKEETKEFVKIRAQELCIDFPLEDSVTNRLIKATGGLPLAIQWSLGLYARTKELNKALSDCTSSKSPLLEFSFRNSWNFLDRDDQIALAVLSIFDEYPTARFWRRVLDWDTARMEQAIASLEEATFVTRRINKKTGSEIFTSLPITLSFARKQLYEMGDIDKECTLRYHDYLGKIQLTNIATRRYSGIFERFNAKAAHQKKAIILSIQAEDEISNLRYDDAEETFKQALDLDPKSVYTLVAYGELKSHRGQSSAAMGMIEKAKRMTTNKTGFHVYFWGGKICSKMHNEVDAVKYLKKALEYEPDNVLARHALGVALSKIGNFDESLRIFDEIIENDLKRAGGPSNSLVYAMKTKIITLRHAGQMEEANKYAKEAIAIVKSQESVGNFAYELEEMVE